MNIKLYPAANTLYPDYHSPASALDRTRPGAGKTASSGNYDKVTINRSASSETDSFARVLAKETAARASEGVSQERVASLRSQVAAGAYHPDAGLIARRMLCQG